MGKPHLYRQPSIDSIRSNRYNMGIVYMIQPTEFLGTKCYKIGRSDKNALVRINTGYHKGTIPILVENVDDPVEVERVLLECFGKRFTCKMGREYFEGDIDDMMLCFKAVTTMLRKGKTSGEQEAVVSQPPPPPITNPKKTFLCNKCNRYFSRKDNLKVHQQKCNGLHPLQCNICLKMFASRQSKHEHKKHVKCSPPPTPPLMF